MWSCDVRWVTLYHFFERSYHNLNFIRIWPEKTTFLRGALGSSSMIVTWTMHGLEILNQCDKKVKTKSQKVLRANSYVL